MKTPTALSAALAAALLLGGLSACGGEPEVAAIAPVRGERLTVTEALIDAIKPASAVVASRDLGEARARIPGTLTQLNVREGDTVRQGQLIGLVIDNRVGLETAAYSAQVAAAEAEAARARADLSRIQTLFDKGIYAQARLDQSLAASRAADAQVRAARAVRSASAETGAQGRILAPTSGRVLTADVPAGSVVSAGQSVATITAGPLVLRLELPEAQGRNLRVGQSVVISSEDLPGVSAGTIAQVYPASTAGQTTADISVAGLGSDRVGQRVTVQVPVGQRRALVIPRRVVATRFGIDFVRTVDRAGRVSEAPVQLGGPVSGDRVEVLSGLAADDVVLAPETAR
ncbi:MAG: efflux RND transporter periplasmic adaptor subunit [Alphaproteobacteria bacterium]|jgi:membrane fusion protein, multidrug efflux system|nr:efflux RND transporter periplasmic adaptor subunit [Alphaproteobacteria bacterium]MBU2040659.1 efflux RND transporter periplasmic adaptor subunit [Alphaproteobacteria bacterium]MBU2208459.1 efflux RND transporter periplasmic adaptor subunit [Alphaproteobacteria bacterium]MBU2396480.1 efflux RND transporter periplasmic adaptor subunit [Alphaproteobacteria bacterium]